MYLLFVFGANMHARLQAIMLGRLKMTVDQCINVYTKLAEKVFVKKAHRFTLTGKVQARYDSNVLISVVKSIVSEAGFDEKTLLWDPDLDACKV